MLICSPLAVLALALALAMCPCVQPTAFASSPMLLSRQFSPSHLLRSARRSAISACAAGPADAGEDELMAVRTPLRWVGPYPALALSFPELATPSMKERGDVGVSLDFVLDTAANTNTINAAVAQQLNLQQVGEVAGGTGAAGAIGGGATFLLGKCELGDLPKQERFEFLSGLTASALPIASPAAAGLLGVSFLDSFPGGVEFRWGGTGKASKGVGEQESSSVTFYGDMQGAEHVTEGLKCIELLRLPASLLPAVSLRVNGVAMRALLDTGSPITVLNAAAATASGVSTPPVEAEGSGGNPFSRLAADFKSVQAAARGDVLSIMGANGKPTQLLRSLPATMSVSSATEGGVGGEVAFGSATCYVGDIPGLAALDGLGAAAGPAAILGMDVLRRSHG